MKACTLWNRGTVQGTINNDPVRTQQHFAEEVNINNIMDRALSTGMAPINQQSPLFGDFSEITSYGEAVERILQANEDFMALPPKIRDRFQNSPEAFMSFISDASNRDEAIRLGLLEVPEQSTPKPAAGPAAQAST